MQTPPNMERIQALAKGFAGSREVLAERLQLLRDELEAAKRARLRGIKNAVADFKQAYADLLEAINDAPALFDKPKSRILHNIKVGYRKKVGKVEFDDDEEVIKLIKKKLPELQHQLINVVEKVDKGALGELSVDEAKKIGVTLVSDGDVAFATPIDDDVKKLMKALISNADLEEVTP